jgi:RNA polymerase sigma factor (TIGR02999 family)
MDVQRSCVVETRAVYTQATKQGQHYQQGEMSDTYEVTLLLAEWAKGNEQALDDLTPLVYRELRKLAASYLRKERQGNTLQPTALVHEAYLRLVDQTNPSWQNRSHFYGVAARLMRQILVDHARRKQARKRGGLRVSLEEAVSLQQERSRDLVASTVVSMPSRRLIHENAQRLSCAISAGYPWKRLRRHWMFRK